MGLCVCVVVSLVGVGGVVCVCGCFLGRGGGGCMCVVVSLVGVGGVVCVWLFPW